MENIKDILKSLNIELDEEQQKTFDEKFNANYRTIKDYQKQKEKLELANQTLSDTQKTFEDFKKNYEGVNVDDLKNQVTTLTETITQKDTEYKSKLSEMTLKSKLKDALKDKNCIDVDTALMLVGMDDLMKSNNQDADLSNAVNDLEQNKSFLFKPQDTGQQINVGGSIGGSQNKTESFKDVLSEALGG